MAAMCSSTQPKEKPSESQAEQAVSERKDNSVSLERVEEVTVGGGRESFKLFSAACLRSFGVPG